MKLLRKRCEDYLYDFWKNEKTLLLIFFILFTHLTLQVCHYNLIILERRQKSLLLISKKLNIIHHQYSNINGSIPPQVIDWYK